MERHGDCVERCFASARLVPLASGDLVQVARFRHAGPHRDPTEEVVSRATVVFTRRGQWSIRTRAGGGRLEAGRVALLDPTRPYRCAHDDATPADRTLSVTFRASLAPLLADQPSLLPGRAGDTVFGAWSVPLTPRLASVARGLAALSDERPALRGLAADALGIQLLLAITAAQRPWSARFDSVDDRAARVAAALRYLDSHADEQIRLGDIARAAGISPFTLARLFRAELGSSPVRELRRIRLAKAAALLRTTDASVTEICFATGHGSLSRFVTAFGAAYGMPPGTWRRSRQRHVQEPATGSSRGKPTAPTRT